MVLWAINHIKELLMSVSLLLLTCAAFLHGWLQILVLLAAIAVGIFALFILAAEGEERSVATMEPPAAALGEGEAVEEQDIPAEPEPIQE